MHLFVGYAKLNKYWLMRVIANLVSSIIIISQVAAIAQWFHLCLPYCGPRFESQAHHAFFNLYYCNCIKKIRKINKNAAPLTSIHRKPSARSFFLLHSSLFPVQLSFGFFRNFFLCLNVQRHFSAAFFLVLFLFSFAYRIGDVSFIFVSNGL